ncbi:MAG: 3-deoxy-D-manno-octulosonic acid transferase [Candidatus Aureabacteria bacterium]|nr:3-deoxy-D-manno-octulosonic acid transferase [Candidatus Auribacterota bacterium]
MIVFYNILLLTILLFGFPFWVIISLKKKYRHGILRKLCIYKKPDVSKKDFIMVHGVSVGEINAAIPFIEQIKQKFPDQLFLVTSSTVTGFINASKKLSGCTIEYFPLDIYPVVKRFYNHFPISKIFILETEIWPNFFYEAQKRGIPITIINARISDHSFKKYLLLKKWIAGYLDIPKRIYCQSFSDEKRFRQLGVLPEKLVTLESMKFDSALLAFKGFANKILPWKKALERRGGAFFLAGSTQEAENRICLECFLTLKNDHPELNLILIPRKPETLNSLFPFLKKKGLSYTLRTQLKNSEEAIEDILLVDTMGELFDFFSVADMVFIGKSLVKPGGGQNPLEPAVFAKPVVMGEYYQNFKWIVEEMKNHDAIRIVQDGDGLRRVLKKWIEDIEERERVGNRAAVYVKNKAGTCEKIINGI